MTTTAMMSRRSLVCCVASAVASTVASTVAPAPANHHRVRLRLSRATCLLLLTLLCLLVLASSMTVVAAYSPLSDEALRRIPAAGADFDIHDGALLAPILVPRVPGTPGSRAVQQHFVRFFRQSLPAWQIQWHNTTARTPATGSRDVPFANLIFRRDPPWAAPGDVARLTLVAHYDTLYRPEGFLGAIDSAAPCAMLLHAARAVDAALTAKWDAMTASGDAGSGLEEERGVQILLLDGEEAWVKWSATDSLYGARYIFLLPLSLSPAYTLPPEPWPKTGRQPPTRRSRPFPPP